MRILKCSLLPRRQPHHVLCVESFVNLLASELISSALLQLDRLRLMHLLLLLRWEKIVAGQRPKIGTDVWKAVQDVHLLLVVHK